MDCYSNLGWVCTLLDRYDYSLHYEGITMKKFVTILNLISILNIAAFCAVRPEIPIIIAGVCSIAFSVMTIHLILKMERLEKELKLANSIIKYYNITDKKKRKKS